MRQEIDGWLDLSGRNDIYLQVSHQNVVAWVRRYMRSTNRNGMVFGSPSLGSLIQHLVGSDSHIVDMTPSAGFLADSFGSASSSLTFFYPTIEAGLIGYFCADQPSTSVLVGDWLSGQFVPPRLQGGVQSHWVKRNRAFPASPQGGVGRGSKGHPARTAPLGLAKAGSGKKAGAAPGAGTPSAATPAPVPHGAEVGAAVGAAGGAAQDSNCLVYNSPSPRDRTSSRMPFSSRTKKY